MERGTLIHARLCGTWAEEVAPIPADAVDASSLSTLKAYADAIGAKRRRSASEQREEIRATQPDVVFADEIDADGKILVSAEQVADVERIAQAVLTNPYAAGMLADCEPEMSAHWIETHEGADIGAKARADLLHSSALVDIKTTSRRDLLDGPEAFAKAAFNFGWHRQLEWYSRGFGTRPAYYFIVVYVGDPALCEVYEMSPDFIEIGRDANDLALDRIASWIRHSDGWQGPSADANGRPTITTAHPLPWMLRNR